MFSTIISVLKAIPVLDNYVQQFVAIYIQMRISEMKKENADAIKKAFDEKDQRSIEKLVNPEGAGKLSGIAGTTIISDLPDVMPRSPDQKRN